MLRQRIITAFVGLPLLIAAIWFGTPWFALIVTAMAIVGALEFYRMSQNANVKPNIYLGILWVALLVISPYCPYSLTTPLLITSVMVISLICILFWPSKEKAFGNWAWTIAGIFYVGWMLSHWVGLRILENGREWVFFTFFATIATDTFAFFVGRAWGKHPMSPTISPSKTWEGAIGGFVGTILISLIVKAIFSLPAFSLPINYWQAALLGGIISIFAQLGDLTESLLKRNTKTKDSGRLLPGHGGILDRIDSIIFSGVVAYYFVTLSGL